MDISIIPQTLQDRQQWVLWRLVERDGKPTKVPFTPAGTPASVSDPNTWTDFQTALEAYKRGGFDGIGFVLTTDAGIVCVDIDHARNCTGLEARSDGDGACCLTPTRSVSVG
jgi:putative DNA primase/helicase